MANIVIVIFKCFCFGKENVKDWQRRKKKLVGKEDTRESRLFGEWKQLLLLSEKIVLHQTPHNTIAKLSGSNAHLTFMEFFPYVENKNKRKIVTKRERKKRIIVQRTLQSLLKEVAALSVEHNVYCCMRMRVHEFDCVYLFSVPELKKHMSYDSFAILMKATEASQEANYTATA